MLIIVTPMTNFPIGVLMAGAVAEVLFTIRRRSEYDHAARFCIAFAAMTAVVTGILGWCFAGIRLSDSDTLLTSTDGSVRQPRSGCSCSSGRASGHGDRRNLPRLLK